MVDKQWKKSNNPSTNTPWTMKTGSKPKRSSLNISKHWSSRNGQHNWRSLCGKQSRMILTSIQSRRLLKKKLIPSLENSFPKSSSSSRHCCSPYLREVFEITSDSWLVLQSVMTTFERVQSSETSKLQLTSSFAVTTLISMLKRVPKSMI